MQLHYLIKDDSKPVAGKALFDYKGSSDEQRKTTTMLGLLPRCAVK